MSETPSRPARDIPDDTVLPFQVDSLDVRGGLARLGSMIDAQLARHAYPKPVSILLAEAAALATLLGSALKFDGRLILQAQGDGPVGMLVVDVEAPGRLRACARFDTEAADAMIGAGKTRFADLLGAGHLAMTVDQGPEMRRYQGVVPLEDSLEATARRYFLQSEQIPTLVRLTVAESITASDGTFRSAWRATGFLLQFLPKSPERRRQVDLPPGDTPPGFAVDEPAEDDKWTTARMLAETVTPDELVEPSLSPERLLYRLFHEQGVRVFEPRPIAEFCRCSRERVADLLRNFSPQARADMTEDGRITVTCEFCSRSYAFAAEATEE